MLGNRAVQTFWGQLSGALSDGIAPLEWETGTQLDPCAYIYQWPCSFICFHPVTQLISGKVAASFQSTDADHITRLRDVFLPIQRFSVWAQSHRTWIYDYCELFGPGYSVCVHHRHGFFLLLCKDELEFPLHRAISWYHWYFLLAAGTVPHGYNVLFVCGGQQFEGFFFFFF